MNRQSNIELLRGVLMLMVVLVHLTGNGVLACDTPIPFTETNWLIANLFDSLCYPAVNCFILVSGYFGLRPTFRKFLKLDIPIVVYGILLWLLFDRHLSGGVRYCFPVLSHSYWFLKEYVLLFLAAPIINVFIENLNRRQFESVLTIAIFLFIVIPSLSVSRLGFADSRGMDFFSFSILYMIGRYIKLMNVHFSKKTAILLYCVCSALIFVLTVILAYCFGVNKGWKSPFYAYNNIFVYIQAISLFFIFKNLRLNEKWSHIINWLSPSFFYIYIIHESPDIHIRLYGWIRSADFFFSNLFVLHLLFSALSIFFICLIIDIARRIIIGRLIDNIVENIACVYTFLSHKLTSIMERYIKLDKCTLN